MMNYPIGQLVQEAKKLPAIPQTAQKALALIRNLDANKVGLACFIGIGIGIERLRYTQDE